MPIVCSKLSKQDFQCENQLKRCERVANANGAVMPLPFISGSEVSEKRRLFLCFTGRQALICLDNLSQLVTVSYSPVSALLTSSEIITICSLPGQYGLFGFYKVRIESRTLRIETEPRP